MKAFQGRKSLKKNWPGGRKKATVIVSAGEDRSVPDWNRQIAAFKRPYWPAKEPVEPSLKEALPEIA